MRASTRVTHAKRTDQTPADLFTRTIALDGPLDDDQRRMLLSIADRCPVDLTLIRGSDVSTSLEAGIEQGHAELSDTDDRSASATPPRN